MSATPRLRFESVRRRVAGEIEIDGCIHPVLQMDVATQETLEKPDPGDGLKVAREAVRKLVPSITNEDLGVLYFDDLEKILMLAGAGLEAVEKAFPNASGPEGQTSPA